MNNLALHLVSTMFVLAFLGAFMVSGILLYTSLDNHFRLDNAWEGQDTVHFGLFTLLFATLILTVLA